MGAKHTKSKATGGGKLNGGGVINSRKWNENADRDEGLLLRNFPGNPIPDILNDLQLNGHLSQQLQFSFRFIVGEKVRKIKEDAREMILSIVTLAREMNASLTRLEAQQKPAKATDPRFITFEMTYANQQENFPQYFEKIEQLNTVYSLFKDYVSDRKTNLQGATDTKESLETQLTAALAEVARLEGLKQEVVANITREIEIADDDKKDDTTSALTLFRGKKQHKKKVAQATSSYPALKKLVDQETTLDLALEMVIHQREDVEAKLHEAVARLNAITSSSSSIKSDDLEPRDVSKRGAQKKTISERAVEFGQKLHLDVDDFTPSDIGALYYLSTVPSMQLGFDSVRVLGADRLDKIWEKNKNKLIRELREVNTLKACNDSQLNASASTGAAGMIQPQQPGHELDASRYKLNDYIGTIIYTVAKTPAVLMKSHLNVMLTGPAGAGKTRFAKIIGNILKACGLLLARKSIDVVSRPDLVGQYIGQSGPRTKSRLISNIENVLFIDEAYMVAQRDNQKGWDPYSSEVIGELVNFLDKTKGTICVIAAGYHDAMHDTFMKINEGMPRRFPYQITLASFTPEELVQLLCYFLREQYGISNALDDSAASYMADTVRDNMNTLFKNSAGDMENLAGIAGARLGILKIRHPEKTSLSANDFKIIIRSYCEQTKGLRCSEESLAPVAVGRELKRSRDSSSDYQTMDEDHTMG